MSTRNNKKAKVNIRIFFYILSAFGIPFVWFFGIISGMAINLLIPHNHYPLLLGVGGAMLVYFCVFGPIFWFALKKVNNR